MVASPFPPCPWQVTDQALSDWREHVLPATEDARLAEHVPTCASCQARLSAGERAERALRGQYIPDLQAGIWRGVRARLAQPGRPAPLARRGIGIGGAVTATVLVAIFVGFLAANHKPPTSGAPTVVVAPTRVPTKIATLSPSPTVFPTLTPAQAWGTAGQQILTLDAQKYVVNDVLPNGRGILAIDESGSTTNAPRPQPRVVLINPTTGVAQTNFTTTSWDLAKVATDGRYIAWAGGFNLTGGPGNSNVTVGYLDTQTGQTRLLSDGTDNALDSTAIYVTHGMLLLVSNRGSYGVYEVNLATEATKTLLPPGVGITVSWPYLLVANGRYSGSGKPDPSLAEPTTLLNLETGQQTDLTQVLNFSYYGFNRVAMDGSTIFVTHPTAAQDGTQFIELDHADQPNPQSRVLFTLPLATSLPDTKIPSANNIIITADSRLLFAVGDIWDRVQQRLVTLPTFSAASQNAYQYPTLLSNGTLAYWQQSGTTTQLVLRDEAQLPK